MEIAPFLFSTRFGTPPPRRHATIRPPAVAPGALLWADVRPPCDQSLDDSRAGRHRPHARQRSVGQSECCVRVLTDGVCPSESAGSSTEITGTRVPGSPAQILRADPLGRMPTPDSTPTGPRACMGRVNEPSMRLISISTARTRMPCRSGRACRERHTRRRGWDDRWARGSCADGTGEGRSSQGR